MIAMTLCKPCLAEGRRTPASHTVCDEPWCKYCFSDEPHPETIAALNRRDAAYKDKRSRAELAREGLIRYYEQREAQECPYNASALAVCFRYLDMKREWKYEGISKCVVLQTLELCCRDAL